MKQVTDAKHSRLPPPHPQAPSFSGRIRLTVIQAIGTGKERAVTISSCHHLPTQQHQAPTSLAGFVLCRFLPSVFLGFPLMPGPIPGARDAAVSATPGSPGACSSDWDGEKTDEGPLYMPGSDRCYKEERNGLQGQIFMGLCKPH